MVQDQEVLAAEVTIIIDFHFVFFMLLIADRCCPNQMERTFIAIKPDGVQRGLVNFSLDWSSNSYS